MSSQQRRDTVVLIGLGANLGSSHGGPRTTLEAALAELVQSDIRLVAVSPWYESAPVPVSDQPWFVNGVALLETELRPEALLARLHELEQTFGRTRRERWEARVLDLDLLDYRGLVRAGPAPILPHPRMADRAFVLFPLRDLVPDWRHPVTGQTVDELIAALPSDQQIRRMEPCAGA
jgi:2-amino-4-hydroxy-6-hydroxymethyldihydropteridine diphosphokinase